MPRRMILNRSIRKWTILVRVVERAARSAGCGMVGGLMGGAGEGGILGSLIGGGVGNQILGHIFGSKDTSRDVAT